MNIRISLVQNGSLEAVYERVRRVAAARGITSESAIREALNLWLEHKGEKKPYALLDVTDLEARMLLRIVAAVRGD